MLTKLEGKVNQIGDKMEKQTKRPLAEAMRQHDIARAEERARKTKEVDQLKEEMERRN